jgi:sec-independent protein translocase protein TatA
LFDLGISFLKSTTKRDGSAAADLFEAWLLANSIRALGYHYKQENFMGPIGVQEMMLIFVVALVLFGPKKMPELGRLLGKGLTEFRRAKNELKSTFETHLRELEREANVDAALKTSTSPYPSPTSPAHYYDESGHYEPSYSSPSPYQEEISSVPTSSPSPIASATATQDAEAYRETPSSIAASPVADTVPRANGIQSTGELPSGPEGHSA